VKLGEAAEAAGYQTAEFAEYAERGGEAVRLSAYSAHSAVHRNSA
jgi:hypothetical protein